jgi:cupin 2 domain-containing protein
MFDSIKLKNVFEEIPNDLPDEVIEILAGNQGIRIERIVSRGHASPPGLWYDQNDNEFVLLIQGKSGLLFEGRNEAMVMRPGDYINIPAHCKHRVEWTDTGQHTVWLAIHY